MTDTNEAIERSARALAEELAREAIGFVDGQPTVVGHKADALDVVTAADVAIEAHARARIRADFPSHAILGEEEGLDREGREWTWVLDPIDGSFNYATRLPGAATAIALMHGDEARIGVIADFASRTVLSGRKGAGVTCGGRPLPPPSESVAELGRARLLIDPGHQSPDPSVFPAIQTFCKLAPVVPRLIGSAAVSLAALALEGGCFVGAGLKIWDAAAGMLLAEERGHTVLWWTYAGDSFHHVLAGDAELIRAFQPAMPDFIRAWSRKDTRSTGRSRDELLGPSATILL